MLTGDQIAEAKRDFPYRTPHDIFHEHDDCIRIAYQWLDAQRLRKTLSGPGAFHIRSAIMWWGQRYVSADDVAVALRLHPRADGGYRFSNLSTVLTLPSDARLMGIGEAGKHPNYRYDRRRPFHGLDE